MSEHFLIIGIGSDLRGDDAAGLVAARQLRNRVPSGVEVIEHHGDGTALITHWLEFDHVIVIDAMISGAETGVIRRIDALSDSLPPQLSASSTHSFGLEEALDLARQLNQLPKRLVVYGIEGKSFSMGTGLSSGVQEAVSVVVEQILQEVSNN
jgi:hydrogenase maturation protease